MQITGSLEKKIKQESKTNMKYNLRNFYWIIKKIFTAISKKRKMHILEYQPRMTSIKAYSNKIIRLLRKKNPLDFSKKKRASDLEEKEN